MHKITTKTKIITSNASTEIRTRCFPVWFNVWARINPAFTLLHQLWFLRKEGVIFQIGKFVRLFRDCTKGIGTVICQSCWKKQKPWSLLGAKPAPSNKLKDWKSVLACGHQDCWIITTRSGNHYGPYSGRARFEFWPGRRLQVEWLIFFMDFLSPLLQILV